MNDFNPKTVKIGKQVWMAENLAIDDGGEGIYKNPSNNEYYYTWDAAMRVVKNIPGWHISTSWEWNEAALACGANEEPYAGNYNLNDYKDAQELKDKLVVKPAGYQFSHTFSKVGSRAYFWTADEYALSRACYRYFTEDALMGSYYNDKTNYAYSIRLVKDN